MGVNHWRFGSFSSSVLFVSTAKQEIKSIDTEWCESKRLRAAATPVLLLIGSSFSAAGLCDFPISIIHAASGSSWRLGGGDERCIRSLHFCCYFSYRQRNSCWTKMHPPTGCVWMTPASSSSAVKSKVVFKLRMEKMGDKLLKWSSWWRNSQISSWVLFTYYPWMQTVGRYLWCHHSSGRLTRGLKFLFSLETRSENRCLINFLHQQGVVITLHSSWLLMRCLHSYQDLLMLIGPGHMCVLELHRHKILWCKWSWFMCFSKTVWKKC